MEEKESKLKKLLLIEYILLENPRLWCCRRFRLYMEVLLKMFLGILLTCCSQPLPGKNTGRQISVSQNNSCPSGEKKEAILMPCGYDRSLFWGLCQISRVPLYFKFCSWNLYIFINNTNPAWLSNRENSAPNSIHNLTCAHVATIDQITQASMSEDYL